MSEQDGPSALPPTTDHPWNRIADDDRPGLDRMRDCERRVGQLIEDRRAHLFVLFLLTVDSACVLADLGYSFLSHHCDEEQERMPTWLEVLSHISLGITCLFLVEILVALFAFGPRYYNPFGGPPQAILHLFDAFVIISTFALEITLKGREQELASLLIILRFWRIVKLMEGVALGAGELNAEGAEELALAKEQLRQAHAELAASQDQVRRLRLRLQTADFTGLVINNKRLSNNTNG